MNLNTLLSDSSFHDVIYSPIDEQDEERDEHLNVADKVEYFLEHCPNLHDYIEETEMISSAVNSIMNDGEGDEMGRIRDLYRDRIRTFSLWVENKYTVSKHAVMVYNAMLKSNE